MTLITLLQAAPAAGGSSAAFWIMMVAIFAVMYFFMIRPQQKQQKELRNFREGLKKGDKIVTIGGIYGTVVEVDDKTVVIKVDGDVKLRMAKEAIQKDYTAQQ